MAVSEKYGRTYHYPFSPGTTSDDRVQHDYWEYITKMQTVVHTEKLDGENNCLSKLGVFARSHAAPSTSPWTESLRRYWQVIRHDIGSLEIFGENLYAVHSIEYKNLHEHFFVFAIRDQGRWLSWEETKFYAAMLSLPVVPEITIIPAPVERSLFEKEVTSLAQGRGAFDPHDVITGLPTTLEGIVTRNAAEFVAGDAAQNVFKYVRKGHVKTDEHWTRNWKRARLKHEGGNHVDPQ
jgi:hypothetical protein